MKTEAKEVIGFMLVSDLFCRPSLFYGCQLCAFSSAGEKKKKEEVEEALRSCSGRRRMRREGEE